MSELEFEAFPKMARLSRNCVITEKLDGTNAQIIIGPNGEIQAGSRTRLIYASPKTADNYGFAGWVERNKDELLKLGEGRHFGEWYGNGIQSGYGLSEKRFALFNVGRWANNPDLPSCCEVVPILYQGVFSDQAVNDALELLRTKGSVAAPGFMHPEGVVIWHEAARILFKKTIHGDESPKGLLGKS